MLTHGSDCQHNRLVRNCLGVERAACHLTAVFLLFVFNAGCCCCSCVVGGFSKLRLSKTKGTNQDFKQ